MDEKTRERALAIFTYLLELAQLRQKPTRDIDDYPRVFWFDDLPEETGCHTVAWAPEEPDADGIWLEVNRQPEPK